MLKPWDRAAMHAAFASICDCGGRQSGTQSEAMAVSLLKRLGTEATGVEPWVETVPYAGWATLSASLEDASGHKHPINPLLRSAATPADGLVAELIDLGRGTPDDFAVQRDRIAGRIVLVRHELMFSRNTIHRRVKYNQAVEAGAAGFLIAGPAGGELVAGSSGRGDEPGPPAAGITPETASALRSRAVDGDRVRLKIETQEAPAVAENLLFDLPGQTDGWVVLSAHIDGHALGESAIDNASGLAVALATASAIAAVGPHKRGLRLALFNVEEWALTGSQHHVHAMTQTQRECVALNVNLDSVGGGSKLTAMTSDFPAIEPMLLEMSKKSGVPINLYRPLQRNSDHANFASADIPAFRLVAGFDDSSAAARLVLTPLDQRAAVKAEELDRAYEFAKLVVGRALETDAATVEGWRYK